MAHEPRDITEAPHDATPIFVFITPHWHADVRWYDEPPRRDGAPGWYQDGWRLVKPTQFILRDMEYEALWKEATQGKPPG
jgi:hypothetical protein